MAKRLFVGSLPWSTTNDELKAAFEAVGKVESAEVIFDRRSGRSKGFGFVEMATEEDAKAAVEKLNESELGGRKIVVNEAKPREERAE